MPARELQIFGVQRQWLVANVTKITCTLDTHASRFVHTWNWKNPWRLCALWTNPNSIPTSQITVERSERKVSNCDDEIQHKNCIRVLFLPTHVPPSSRIASVAALMFGKNELKTSVRKIEMSNGARPNSIHLILSQKKKKNENGIGKRYDKNHIWSLIGSGCSELRCMLSVARNSILSRLVACCTRNGRTTCESNSILRRWSSERGKVSIDSEWNENSGGKYAKKSCNRIHVQKPRIISLSMAIDQIPTHNRRPIEFTLTFKRKYARLLLPPVHCPDNPDANRQTRTKYIQIKLWWIHCENPFSLCKPVICWSWLRCWYATPLQVRIQWNT